MANPLIIDGRNLLDPAEARAAGFVYEGIGRPASTAERHRARVAALPVRRGGDHPLRRQGRAPRRRRRRPAEVARRGRRAGRSPPTRWRGSAQAGVDRVIMACAAGPGELFERELAGLGPEVVAAEEPERFGRGGGIKFAAASAARSGRRVRAERRRARRGRLRGAARAPPRGGRRRDGHRRPSRALRSASSSSAAATRSRASARAARSPTGSAAASTCSPRRRSSASPSAATTSRRRSPSSPPRAACAYRHEGLWLTVNTPKELRTAADHVEAHPEWLARERPDVGLARALGRSRRAGSRSRGATS